MLMSKKILAKFDNQVNGPRYEKCLVFVQISQSVFPICNLPFSFPMIT